MGRPGATRRMIAMAKAEVRRSMGTVDPRTLGFGLLLTLAFALVAPEITEAGLDFDHGLYRVSMDETSPLGPAILASPLFERVAPADPVAALALGEVDLVVTANSVLARDTEKGNAALVALERAVASYTHSRLRLEKDAPAAFPVEVELQYVARTTTPAAPPGTQPSTDLSRPERTGDESGGETSGTVSGGAPRSAGGDAATGEEGALSRFLSILAPERTSQTPATLSAPFPLRPLILAYLFLVPMNFVVLVYGGSIMNERIALRGEALLASPARRWEIVAGKTLPYFLLIMGLGAGTALAIGGGVLSLLAVATLGLAFLGLVFAAAMFSRSFRELTFLTVVVGVGLTAYAFVPAIFSEVHPIALISPMTLVVFELRGRPVEAIQLLYSAVPLLLASAVLFHLGSSLYTEEDLFHQKSVRAKILDALARGVRGPRSGFALAVLLLPFVLVAELLIVALLFASPLQVGLLASVVAAAFVEEVFKGVPAYAALSRGVIAPRDGVRFGVFTGLGFFVAEKTFLMVSLVGLFSLPVGAAVFGDAGSIGIVGPVGVLLLAGPLLLHVVTAAISALGARSGPRAFAVALLVAVAVHAAYNLAVIRFVGGDLG